MSNPVKTSKEALSEIYNIANNEDLLQLVDKFHNTDDEKERDRFFSDIQKLVPNTKFISATRVKLCIWICRVFHGKRICISLCRDLTVVER